MKRILWVLVVIIVASCTTKQNKAKENSMKEIQSTVSTKGVVELKTKLVWNKLIAFGGTEKFVPDLIERVTVEGVGIGAIRNIYLKGGGKIIEKMTKMDKTNHRMEFIILSTPMPISNYTGIVEVHELSSNTCQVMFTSDYDVSYAKKDEMESAIKEFQETFISNLDK